MKVDSNLGDYWHSGPQSGSFDLLSGRTRNAVSKWEKSQQTIKQWHIGKQTSSEAEQKLKNFSKSFLDPDNRVSTHKVDLMAEIQLWKKF